MDKKNKLDLDIPERTPPPEGSFLTKPKAVEAWISSLPMANTNETSRQVFKAIVDFNRMVIPNLPRLKAAEMFRGPIHYITENLKRYYFDTPFPLSAKNRKIAVLNRELYMELAAAYKIVIVEMIAGDARKIDKNLLVVAIQRAMRCLASVLYQSVIVYDPFPMGVWGEINRLYAYAEQNRVHELGVKDTQQNRPANSIREIYMQVLLFSVISPYRLRQREIEHCYHQLPAWSAYVTLSMPERISSSTSLFVTRLSSDNPPSHIKLQTSPIDRHCRQLDAINLVQLLQSIYDSVESDQLPQEGLQDDDPGNRQLLGKLIQVMEKVQKRKYVRTRLNFELKIVVGLPAIHSLLQLPAKAEITETEAPQVADDEIDWFTPRETKPLINVPETTGTHAQIHLPPDAGLSGQETIVALDADGIGYPGGTLPAWVASTTERAPEPFSCTTDNESAWGYCILWPPANTSRVRVGELLGIHVSGSSTSHYRVGISRWLRNLPGVGIQVGMEIVGLDSIAVGVTPVGVNDPSENPVDCILLPESKSTGQRATLLTPVNPFAVEDEVVIEDPSGRKSVRLIEKLESTGAFCRFQFEESTDPHQRR
ncbi:MAG: hypothetical protein KDI63_06160 [Gammaproteobacteria bacterium]|nr:hypothetical protein [Gammaproteobacteria bacterium]